MITASERSAASLADLAAELGGTVGVCARNLATDASIAVGADELFPLASVFKIPIMVEVMRQVDRGDLRLDERLTLTEADKSPGSTLIHCHPGLELTVRDLLYLMITLSDNTATDMLWRRVNLGSVNSAMRALGLRGIDCTMPNREYFLLQTGLGSDWAGLNGPQTVARWRALEEREGRETVFARLLDEHASLSGAAFLRLSDRRWGYDGSRAYADAFAIDQALDNLGTPRDVAELLATIAEARCASAPSCRLMIEIMSRQEWREKIPAGLPPGLLVVNKTGGVTGTSNDAAIVYTPERVPIVMVVFCKGLSLEATGQAPSVIARIAACVYDALTAGDGADGAGPAAATTPLASR